MSATSSRWWSGVAVASCALGMACKESMVTAPILVAVFDRVFLFDSFAAAWRARKRLYIGLMATWLLLAGLLMTGPRPHSAGFSSGLSPVTYLLNQPSAIGRYLGLTFWPDSLVLIYGPPTEMVLRDTLPSAALIVFLMVLTLVAVHRWPRVGFLGLWFWITLAPASSIVPIATEVAAERRMYLPLAAIAALVVLGAARLLGDRLNVSTMPGRSRTSLVTTLAVLLIISTSAGLAAVTVERNREYASPVVMARTLVDRYPNENAHLMLARALLGAGERGEGMRQLEKALPAAGAQFTLGMELLHDGRAREGLAQLRAFVAGQRPFLQDVIVARTAIGGVLMDSGHWPQAEREFRLILDVLPGDAVAEHGLAEALFAQGLWEEAVVHYRAHLTHAPDDAGALNNLGIALGSTGQLDQAALSFHRALEIDPNNAPAERNLAALLLGAREFESARIHAQRAATLQPDDPGSHELLGRIWLSFGRLSEAEEEFKRALSLDPSLSVVRRELEFLEKSRDHR